MTSDVPDQVLDYLRQQKTLTLASNGDDGPWAATLTFVNDGPDIYVWTKPSSITATHVRDQPTVAFAIDDYTDDWRQARGIQGRGECAAVTGEEIATAAELFGEKFPDLRPGATSAVIFLRISPRTLEFIDNTSGVDESDEFGADYRRQSLMAPPLED